MSEPPITFQEAEALRKAGQYPEAGAAFHRLWDEQGDAGSGWRYAQCLRKAGHPNAALQVIEQVVAQHPDDQWAGFELAWCIYEALVKPARDEGHLGKLLYAGQKMIEADAQDLPLRLTVFAIVKVAKAKGKWAVVSEWCDRLDPLQLSTEPNTVGERKTMPDRERWYFAKVKALVKLEQWAEARRLALEAAQAFPRRIDFRRWAAQARAGEGDAVGGIEELEKLARQGDPPWYIMADIAQMQHQLGEVEAALQRACKAALAPGEDKAKVRLFLLIAEIGLATGRPEIAAWHVALTKAVRRREGWPIRGELVQLEKRVTDALAQTDAPWPDLPGDAEGLLRGCEKIWHEQAMAGLERKTGVICHLPEGRKYGFIKPDDGGPNIYFRRREIPRRYAVVGQRVEFAIEPSYDPKKKQESVKAVDIRPIT
ncbi:MAG: hypothetical protein DRH24_18220 [Deltaproteobacteria bacterium]|nr:MAG: hypothetical protein DRH24_18220 [Deltaproteobacteria bacterium]